MAPDHAHLLTSDTVLACHVIYRWPRLTLNLLTCGKIYIPRHDVSKKIGNSALHLSWFKIVSLFKYFHDNQLVLKNVKHPGEVHDDLFNTYTGHKSLK